MRYLLLILALTGCATRDYAQLSIQVGNNGLSRYDDLKAGNVCYIYRDSDNSSLSCVKK